MNKQSLLSAFLAAILICGLAIRFVTVQAATDVSGIISSDTTWTEINSPYNFTGPVAVSEGVTLTIQPGVIVNINNHLLRVNGTLRAQGTPDNRIVINIGSTETYYRGIEFESCSVGWDNQTNSGSILQYAVITSSRTYYSAIEIESASPKIDNNIIGCAGYDNAIECWGNGSPIISNNTIAGRLLSHCYGGYATISSNTIIGPAEIAINVGGDAAVVDNTLAGADQGILCHDIGSDPDFVTLMRRNLIINNKIGIRVHQGDSGHDGPNVKFIVENNTITNNIRGIFLDSESTDHQIEYGPIIENNNLFNNYEYNLETSYYTGIDVSYNYWGTTHAQAINQTIRDFYDDFNLGIVTFIPFLNEPNPDAPVIPSIYSFNVSVEAQIYNITAVSNSGISEISFNQNLKELSFNVEGLVGTNGFCSIAIPATLMSGTFSIYKDDILLVKDVDYTEIYNGTHYLFDIFYNHSVHTIQIESSQVIPDLPSNLLMLLMVMSLSVGVIFLRKKLLKSNNLKYIN